MKLTDRQLKWFQFFISRLLERKVVLQLLSEVQNREIIGLTDNQLKSLRDNGFISKDNIEGIPSGIGDGDVVKLNEDKNIFGYLHEDNLYLLSEGKEIPMHWSDTFELQNGLIGNYKSDTAITTTVGRLLLNYCVLVNPFGDTFEYINDKWKPGDIEDIVADALRNDDVTVQQVKNFVNNSYYIGSLSHLCVVTATEKSFKTDPEITKRKRELFEQHKGELDDPIVAKKVEDELLEMDKQYLEGDKSKRYYDAMGPAAYKNHRKKMFLAEGSTPRFEEGSSHYEFIENSLAEGWDPEDFPTIVNELRKGSFNRGHQTQLGGAMAKNFLRLFQNVELTEVDCGTTRTIKTTIPADQIKFYKGRTIIYNGKKIVLTQDNLSDYADKEIKLRSPVYCRTQKGLCYTCTGQIFKDMDQKAINMMIVEVANTFMQSSMKAMHDTTVDTMEIDSLEPYFSPFV